MKRFLKRKTAVLMVLAMSMSLIGCATMAEGREILLLSQNFDNIDLNANWVTNEKTGTITDVDSDLYTTSAEGFDSLVIPNLTVTDAAFSADFKVTSLNMDSNAFFGIRLRNGDNGGYQMVYYPSAAQIKLQRLKADGTVETTKDLCSYIMNEGETYNMAFSVKDGSLRGEINGEVWLRAFDYKVESDNTSDGKAYIENGSAAVVSNLQSVSISNPKMTGEDKLFYDNFESGRVFADVATGKGYGEVSAGKNKGVISTAGGKLVLSPNGTENPTIYIKHQGTDVSNAWKNTVLSFDAASDDSFDFMNIQSHILNDLTKSYLGFIHNTLKYSNVKKAGAALSNLNLTDYGKNLSIKNKSFSFKAETKTSSDNSRVDLKYYIDEQEVMSASDASSPVNSTGGGISINPVKGSLTIDNLTIKDGNATTKAEDTISIPKMNTWTQDGGAKGTFGKEKAYKVTNGQNGDLVLRDFSQKNVAFSADIDIDESKWTDSSQVVLFSRYINNGHNVRMVFSKKTDKNPSVGVLICNNGVIVRKDVSMSYNPGTKFKMELQAKDGVYRALINGKTAAELTSTEELQLKGTVGIQVKDAAATVKNVLVKEENRMWLSDIPTEASKTYTYSANPEAVGGIDHVAFCADIQIPDLKWSQFFMKSRMNVSSKAYSANFRTDGQKVYVKLMENSWSPIFVAEKDITSHINVGGMNRIIMETEDSENGDVLIKLSVNGNQVVNFTDNGSIKDTSGNAFKLTSASGANRYDFCYPKAPGTAFTNAKAWIECLGNTTESKELNIDYKLNKESLSAGDKIKAELSVENTTGEDFGAVIFAALYNADGVLCEVTPITEVTVTAQEMYKTVPTGELTVPNNPSGYRAVAYCWNSISGMKPKCQSETITAAERE